MEFSVNGEYGHPAVNHVEPLEVRHAAEPALNITGTELLVRAIYQKHNFVQGAIALQV